MIAFRTIRGLAYRLHRQFTAIPPPLNLSHGQPPPTPFRPPPPKRSPLRQFLKFGALGILAPVGAIGCVTFAYTLDEVHEMTEGFTSQYRLTQEDYDSSSILLRIMDLAAYSIQVYWGCRFFIQDTLKENRQCTSTKLLPDVNKLHPHLELYTLVFDLNDTLVHSDWMLPLLRGQPFKRPGMEAFLKHVLELGYESVLYTDEISMYEIVLHHSMEQGYFHTSLTRGSTIKQDGKYYRDLSRLNRDPSKILYVSAHALENCLQPENCVPIKPWNKDMEDTTLSDLLQFLHFVAYERPDDIRLVLSAFNSGGKDVLTEFKNYQRRRILELEVEETKKFNMQKKKESLWQKWWEIVERQKTKQC